MSSINAVSMNRTIDQGSDRRHDGRDRVIKGAQLIYHDSVIDCIVLDISPNGAKVRTSAVVVTPEQVILQLRGGAAFLARRRWARGMEISFAFEGPAPLGSNAALVAKSALDALSEKGLPQAVRILRAVGFFDDPGLGQLAEEAENAYARLEMALTERAKQPA